MSKAISIFHGKFGRATFYHLDGAIIQHTHREGHLLFHVTGSTSSMSVNGTEYRLDADHGVAVNPWALHGYCPDAAIGQYLVVLYLRPDWVWDHGVDQHTGLKFGSPSFAITAEIARRLGQLVEILTDTGNADMFDDILYGLVKACQFESNQAAPQSSYTSSCLSNDFRIRKSVSLLALNEDISLDLNKVASDAGLSRPHFFKLFRTQLGVTPKMYWNTLRLERAFSQLVETRKSICDISLDLGFSSQSSFSRFFTLNTGITPSDYRRVGHLVA